MFKLKPVTDEAILHDSINVCSQLWGLRPCEFQKKPPSSQPKSLMRRDLAQICTHKHNYIVSAKTDGVRMFLLVSFALLENEEEQEYMVFVDRTGSFYEVPNLICTKPDLYNGTLIDGELLPDGSYVMFDAVAVSGFNLKPLPFLERLDRLRQAVASFVNTPGGDGDSAPVKCELKEWAPLHDAERIYSNTKCCDGVIIANINEACVMGTMRSTFKWKPSQKHTIDFSVELDVLCTPPKPQLWLGGGRRAAADTLNIKPSHDFMQRIPLSRKKCIVECSIEKGETGKKRSWIAVPVKLRQDKRKANSVYVAKMTLQTITDNVHLNEMI